MADKNETMMESKIREVADRVKGIRLDLNLTTEQMAQRVGIPEADYIKYEEGHEDFNFTFVYKVANIAGIDIADLMEGSSPSLSTYAVTRNGEGRPIARREGFKYLRLGSRFKSKLAEPFRVTIPYSEEALNPPYELVTHSGQEMNIV